MPRGGRRPGAGAPKGNHNALKTGKYSKRFREAMSNLINTPEFRASSSPIKKGRSRTSNSPTTS